jgi:hypothetical protein
VRANKVAKSQAEKAEIPRARGAGGHVLGDQRLGQFGLEMGQKPGLPGHIRARVDDAGARAEIGQRGAGLGKARLGPGKFLPRLAYRILARGAIDLVDHLARAGQHRPGDGQGIVGVEGQHGQLDQPGAAVIGDADLALPMFGQILDRSGRGIGKDRVALCLRPDRAEVEPAVDLGHQARALHVIVQDVGVGGTGPPQHGQAAEHVLRGGRFFPPDRKAGDGRELIGGAGPEIPGGDRHRQRHEKDKGQDQPHPPRLQAAAGHGRGKDRCGKDGLGARCRFGPRQRSHRRRRAQCLRQGGIDHRHARLHPELSCGICSHAKGERRERRAG